MTVLRIGGVLACLADAVFTVVHRFRSPNRFANLGDAVFGVDFPLGFLVATDILVFVLVAASFWYLAQERHMISPSRRAVGVLLVQVLTSLLVSPGINYIGSAQAGFLFSLPMGLIWIAAQSFLEVAAAVAFPGTEDSMLPLYLQGLSGVGLWAATVAIAAIYHLLAFGLGYLGADSVRQRLELARRNAELEATQQIEADGVRLAERLTIARDLHDELGHHLTALSLNLQLASKQSEGTAKETVEAAYLLARTVLSDIRNTVTDLRSATSVQLPRALRTLVGGIANPKVHLNIGSGLEELDPLPSHALFRSAQELITNALRHASAANLWIELRAEPGSYTLQVRDDGRGVEKVELGNGLKGMIERVQNLGGTVEFGAPAQGKGFQASIQLPRKVTC